MTPQSTAKRGGRVAGPWTLSSWDDLPERFNDPRCDEFRTFCSNGFVGDISLGSAFTHKPSFWPQCFPDGPDGDASCTTVLMRAPSERQTP